MYKRKPGIQATDSMLGSGDMKVIIAIRAGDLTRDAGRVMAVEEPWPLIGWGHGIRGLESLMWIYVQNDTEYHKLKATLLKKLSRFKGYLKISERQEYFNLYNIWFRTLCLKMALFGIYPEVSSELTAYSHQEYLTEEEVYE